MVAVRDFVVDAGLDEHYAARFVEQGIDTVDDLRYERDLDTLLEDVGVRGDDATTFREALKRALAGEKKRAPSGDDLAEAVKASMANSRARQGLDGDGAGGSGRVTGGAVRMGGAKVEDYAPKLTLDDVVTDDVNARMGVATAKEIEDILAAHRDKDFLRLLKLREVPIDSLGKVEWSGHEAVKTNEIAMRCKLLSLRLDKSRNAHPKAPAAQRAVKNVLDLLSHKDTRKEYLTLAVRRKVEQLRADGKIQGGGHVSFTGVHYGSGAAATRMAEENYVSKDMLNEMPTYDETIHLDMSDENARERSRRAVRSPRSRPRPRWTSRAFAPSSRAKRRSLDLCNESQKCERARASRYNYAKPLLRTTGGIREIHETITVRDRAFVEPPSRAIDILDAQLVPHVLAQRHHPPRQPPRLQRPLHGHQRIGPTR